MAPGGVRSAGDPGDPGMADTSPPPEGPGSSDGTEAVDRRGPRQVRPGDALGRYELGEEVGEGGMATVFRARDRELRREVAIKVLFPHLARRAEIVQRFHREARAAAGLEHPNILRIYDVGGGEGDDPPYIVMELVRGRTLLEEIEQRGAMLAEIAACIGALLGDALAAAHAAGIIHRDVKPANVLIAPGGRLLLGDFGVARLETEDSLVTRTGALLGTPAYMSPEQAGGDVATTRSDVYSLGATLYQLATGALPYSGPPAKIMSQIATGALVPPVRRKPSCGPDLSRLVERMMAREAEGRPASAIAVATELRALAAAGGLGDPSEELAAYFADPEDFLRTRTPTVVTSLITAARGAVAASRLPRAMALADRASALAPDDRAVTALVETVTEGGRTSRRNRSLMLGAVAALAVGGLTTLGFRLARSTAAEPAAGAASVAGTETAAAPGPATAPTAGSAAAPAAGSAAAPAAAAAPAPGSAAAPAPVPVPDAGTGAVVVSGTDPRTGTASRTGSATTGSAPGSSDRIATRSRPADAGRGPRTGAPALPTRPSTPPQDASSTTPAPPPPQPAPMGTPPAIVTPPPSSEPPPSPGHVIVRNDVWCRIWIDGTDRGIRRNEVLEVAPGKHTVRCVNPAGEWTQEVEVAAGATRTVSGSLLRELDVTLAVDAEIDGKRYRRGAVVKLKPGNVEVIVGGKKQFITFRASCRLTDVPALGCYL